MGNKLTSIVKNSNISIIKTIGAALAAVTVAMISSHLAGYVNSLEDETVHISPDT